MQFHNDSANPLWISFSLHLIMDSLHLNISWYSYEIYKYCEESVPINVVASFAKIHVPLTLEAACESYGILQVVGFALAFGYSNVLCVQTKLYSSWHSAGPSNLVCTDRVPSAGFVQTSRDCGGSLLYVSKKLPDVLSQFPPFRYFLNFSSLWKHALVIEHNVHIEHLSPKVINVIQII